MVWNASQRGFFAAAYIALSERDLKHLGHSPGIVIKRLVEIAHAKKQQGVRILRLRFQVLLPSGRDL